MKLIDTHCHPQFPQYDQDREEVIKRALDGGVQMICVGTDYRMSVAAIELAAKYDGVWASVGLHPNDNLDEAFDSELYYKLGLEKKVVACGEIGLDYYRTKDSNDRIYQKKRFVQQIEVALKLKLPTIIHCREAHIVMIELLKAYSLSLKSSGVIHSFTGAWEKAKKYIDLGFYIGLNGIITFTEQYNETVINVPLDRILLETDAPYLAPVPFRGQRNEPSYVKYVAQKIAELKKISVEEIAKVTTQNAEKLFRLPPKLS